MWHTSRWWWHWVWGSRWCWCWRSSAGGWPKTTPWSHTSSAPESPTSASSAQCPEITSPFLNYGKRDNPLQHNWKQLTNQSIFVERGKKSMYLNVKNISNDCLEFEIRMVPPLGSILFYTAFRFPLLVAMFDNNFKHISRTQSGKSSHSWEDKLNLQPCKNCNNARNQYF